MYEEIENAINDNDLDQLNEIFNFYKNSSINDEKAASLIAFAIEKGYGQILKNLLKHFKNNFNDFIHRDRDDYGSCDVPLLIIAISHSNLECVKILVEKGGLDVNLASDDCFSPLGYAFYQGENEIASYLLMKKAILNNTDIGFFNKPNAALTMEELIDRFKDTKKIKFDFADVLTERSKHTRKGIKPIESEKKIRKYHSFEKSRERQLLRHVATQLYFSLKPENEKLIEIQAMHLICNGNSNLFIAANEYEITKAFKAIKSKDFKSKLITPYTPGTKEALTRSSRYSKKLERRIFGDKAISGSNQTDLKYANYLKQIIRKKNIEVISLNYSGSANDLNDESKKNLQKILEKDDDKIFFLVIKNCSYKDRHAEEFLCDIAKIAKLKFGIDTVDSSIAGKKRPCLGCFGRMNAEEITNHGKYPGLFFKHTIANQPAEVAAQTLDAFNGPIYLSAVSPKNKQLPVSDFDSGSDSTEVTASKSCG